MSIKIGDHVTFGHYRDHFHGTVIGREGEFTLLIQQSGARRPILVFESEAELESHPPGKCPQCQELERLERAWEERFKTVI